jgi:methylphosphotriester-DNA--protein-cysteine methyltransferase
MAGRRADAGEYAERVNAAADLVDAGVGVAEAVRLLAARFGLSQRQARRYVERAADSGPVAAAQVTTVFTVKLPIEVAGQIRDYAKVSGQTISVVVSQALQEFLSRGAGQRAGR